ncbi:MAG: hypothetical protein UW86_C0003G0028 [Microgenomates group bacterium GW2011_GWA1_Microgenomates_45_10]|nr:MAG: hypothetical protein UW73_C0015G0028 [Microgenomates group bacterium GW2011_GWB1_44_8]KKT87383.1 MAG: hypothetical protein UW86_C0003G0028 [Microgenomates group bacterium GW2011_GWA1_Microgenomates_45_10]
MDRTEFEGKVTAIRDGAARLGAEKPYTCQSFWVKFNPVGIRNTQPGLNLAGRQWFPVNLDEALRSLSQLNKNTDLRSAREWAYKEESEAWDFYSRSKGAWEDVGSPKRTLPYDVNGKAIANQGAEYNNFYYGRETYFKRKFVLEEIDAYVTAYTAGFNGKAEVKKKYLQVKDHCGGDGRDPRVANYFRMVKLSPAVEIIKGRGIVGLYEKSQWAMALLALDQIERSYDPDYLAEMVRVDLNIIGQQRDGDEASKNNPNLNAKLNAVVGAAEALGLSDVVTISRRCAPEAAGQHRLNFDDPLWKNLQ